MIPYRPRKQLS
uniref:Uncharacterized protein n=1 Tax=Anguilla anguilla TaxID=7936 RepID=A0A0E9UGV6_ANGAN